MRREDVVPIKHLLTVAVSLLASVSIAADAPVSSTFKQSFLVFDGLLYKGKPDLGALGMTPIRGINPPGTLKKPSDGVDEVQVHATLQTLRGYAGAVYLDYEIWPTFHASPA